MPQKKSPPIPRIASKSPASARTKIRSIWNFGRKLATQRTDSEPVERLKKRLRLKEAEDLIYKAIQFADRVTKDELDDLLKLKFAENYPLSWSHFAALISIDDKDTRMACATAAAAQRLSNRALRELIQTTLGTGNRRLGSGRQWLTDTPVTEAIGRISEQFALLEAQLQAFKKLNGIQGVADREIQIDGMIGYVDLCQKNFESIAHPFAQDAKPSSR